MKVPSLKVTMYMGLSLDGMAARANDGLDFLDPPGGEPPSPPPDDGTGDSFRAFLDSVDVMLMGRRTYEVVRGMGPAVWPYGDKPIRVLSNGLAALPADTRPSVTLDGGPPAALLDRLAAEGVRHVYVDGARTTRAFLAAGLVTDLVVTFVPVLVGSGISPWGELPADIRLELVDTEVLAGGNVQLRYRVRPGQPARDHGEGGDPSDQGVMVTK